VDGCPQVKLSLHGLLVDALVDTGASRTLIEEQTFKKVCLAQGRTTFLNTSGRLVSVTGGSLNVKGETHLKQFGDIGA
jgi:predicted aspartyl protease